MYTVYIKNGSSKEVCIYDPASPAEELRLISPKLTLEDNSAGSFETTIAKSNAGFDIINRLSSDVIVRKKEGSSEVTVWTGRIISETNDFYGSRRIECEGALSFLNDTYQPQKKYLINKKGVTGANVIKDFLGKLLDIHNGKSQTNHKIYLGEVTVKDKDQYLYRYTNFDTTLNCIKEKLLDRLGGHIVIRYENGRTYLDYLSDFHKEDSSLPSIEFGRNLLDFTKNWDMSYFASAILPLGKRIEKESDESESNENKDTDETGVEKSKLGTDDDDITVLEEYVTVKDVNNGDLYVKADKKVINTYGLIEAKVVWDNISKPSTLLAKAKKYLKDLQFDSMYMEVSAFDLSELNADYKRIKMLDRVRVYSAPHGLERLFPVTKMEIPLDDPSGIVFGMGVQVSQPLTGLINNSK